MKKVYIMIGVPGAGKGHWLQRNAPDSLVCSADHYFYANSEDGETYAFDPKLLPQAHGACRHKFEEAVKRGDPEIAVDNTNLYAIHIKPYMAYALDHGYEVEGVRVTPRSFHEAWRRNTHGVPEDAHNRMVVQFEKRSLPNGLWIREVSEQ